MCKVTFLGSARGILQYVIMGYTVSVEGEKYTCNCEDKYCTHISEVKKYRGNDEIDTRATSIKNIRESEADLTQQEEIFKLLTNHPEGLCREEIAEELGIKLTSVCGRVKELLEEGAIEIRGNKINPYSEKQAEALFSKVPFPNGVVEK